MKKLVILAILICCAASSFAQTYYYKQEGKVVDGKKSPGDNGGQFITITHKSCFDSDREGFTVYNGTLPYVKSEKGLHIYYGDSFWGKARYCFTTDYGRLNVIPDDGSAVYVYHRSAPGTAVLTSSLIREREPIPDYLPVDPVPPVIILGGDGGGGTVEDNRSSTTTSKLVNVKCSFCDGSCISPLPRYSPNYTGKSHLQYCHQCGKTLEPHTHDKCPSCNGKGYTQRRQ